MTHRIATAAVAFVPPMLVMLTPTSRPRLRRFWSRRPREDYAASGLAAD
jgi:hypothetical protein